MAPILYHCTESQVSRFVEIVIKLIGVDVQLKHVDLFNGAQFNPDFVKLAPRHQVPFLVDGDLKIGECRAIATYLVDTYAKGESSLYPKDRKERAKIDELLYFDASHLLNCQRACTSPKLYGGVLAVEHEPAYRDCLKYLEGRLSHGHKFLLGDTYNLADLIISCNLSITFACEYSLNDFPNILKFIDSMYEACPIHAELGKPATDVCHKFMYDKRALRQAAEATKKNTE